MNHSAVKRPRCCSFYRELEAVFDEIAGRLKNNAASIKGAGSGYLRQDRAWHVLPCHFRAPEVTTHFRGNEKRREGKGAPHHLRIQRKENKHSHDKSLYLASCSPCIDQFILTLLEAPKGVRRSNQPFASLGNRGMLLSSPLSPSHHATMTN